MHIHSFRIRNFRRLKDVRIDLDVNTSIFVGANNSGKTSAAQIFQAFLGVEGERAPFSIYDFSADCWARFDKIGFGAAPVDEMPSIELDLWFEVNDCDLHYVIALLPSLDWDKTLVGVRMKFAPKDPQMLVHRFQEEHAIAQQRNAENPNAQRAANDFHPWPATLTDYLKKCLSDEYKLFYYVLDCNSFNAAFEQAAGYTPSVLGDGKENGAAIMKTLLRVDFLTAQRHQIDAESSRSGKGGKLAKRLSEMYRHSQKKNGRDFKAVAALAESEMRLNDHMREVFEPTLQRLNKLGYPGLADPYLVIKSALNPESILTDNARVHYALRDPGAAVGSAQPPTLPDKYNGLGFKNLIYMVIEVLEAHRRWAEEEENRPPLHLIIIEEPEAHLHVQLQQVFIRKIRELLPDDDASFFTQMIVTTHSSHIIYESNFDPIRYFRRSNGNNGSCGYSDVLNLSNLRTSEKDTREFLLQYIKLTHCDLFFADAAVLVEGNVERLLLPLMIKRVAPELESTYLSIIEIGGAFAHLFRELIEFLGVTTLVITDLDSVLPPKPKPPPVLGISPGGVAMSSASPKDDDEDEEEIDNAHSVRGRICRAEIANAETSNQTLRKWLPGRTKISDLLAAAEELKLPKAAQGNAAKVRVAFQTPQSVTWRNEAATLTGRTFEEAFAFENLTWSQMPEQKLLGLSVKTKAFKVQPLDLAQVTENVHSLIKNRNFDKTRFALALIMQNSDIWKTPGYIEDGLQWLKAQLLPNEVVPKAESAQELVAAE